jgi:apolipoprotein N-acyltransferase
MYVGVFGLAFILIRVRWGLPAAFVSAPFLWICLEYLKSNLSFMGLPWLLLSHTQYQYPYIIQVAAFTGAHGISFLIVMVNATLAVVALKIGSHLKRNSSPSSRLPSRGEMLGMIICTLTLILLTLLYGWTKLSSSGDISEFKVAVAQGNIAQARKWDREYAGYIMDTYADLSRQAAADQPDLIVWPETATPGSLSQNRRLNAQVRSLAKEISIPILLGSSLQQKFGHKADAKFEYKNSAFLIPATNDAVRHQRYDKIHLLPFGEYLPLKGTIPWSAIDIPNITGYTAGEAFTVFEMPNVKFAVTICWENIFPELVRQFVKNGAQFIVNITNEAWFGRTAAPYQFLSMSVLRAVENGVFVIRCANTGISGFIDLRGRVYERIANEQGQDIFIRGVRTATILPQNSKTFYTCHGEWIVGLAIVVSIIFLIPSLSVKRRI